MERSARNSSSQSQSSQPTPAANEMINTSLSGKRLSDLPSGPPSVAAQGNLFDFFFKLRNQMPADRLAIAMQKVGPFFMEALAAAHQPPATLR